MDSYAAPADLAEWITTNVPPNAVAMLRSATIRVARACMRNPYTDVPSTADAPVLNDATCAQAASWITLGIDPNAQGLGTGPVKSSTILGATVARDTTGQAEATMAAANGLCPESTQILTAAGLISLALPVSAPPEDQLLDYGLGDRRPWWAGYTGDLDWFFQ